MKRVIHVHIDTGKNPNNIHVTTFKYYPYWEIFVGDQQRVQIHVPQNYVVKACMRDNRNVTQNRS